MATFTIRGHVGQFSQGTADPDTIIVKEHASVITADPAAFYLDGLSGAWTIKIDGLVRSTGNDAQNSFGILLNLGLAVTSKITVGKTGKIDGLEGIDTDSPVSITNYGTIQGDTYPLFLSDAKDVVVNSGKIVTGLFDSVGVPLPGV